jgi:integrase
MARNGDGLYRRGSIWHFKYLGKDGQYHEKSTGKRSFSEARGVRDDELKLFREGQLPTDRADWTLEQALAEALEYRRATLARTTAPPEKSAAKRLKAILGAKRRLKSLTGVDLRKYQAVRRKTVGPKTVNNELLLLISILKQAKLWRRLEEDYRPLPVPKKGPGVALTVEQTNTLIAIASKRSSWFVAMNATLLAYATGCRSWEIKCVRLQDIVLDGPTPLIRIRRENTKSNAGAREVALNDYAVWALRRLIERAARLGATRAGTLPITGQSVKTHQAGGPRLRPERL